MRGEHPGNTEFPGKAIFTNRQLCSTAPKLCYYYCYYYYCYYYYYYYYYYCYYYYYHYYYHETCP
jgi:hypothetical protein